MDDDERFGAGLREMMLTVDVPPPRADVPGAKRVARRRDQRRIAGIAALSVVVVAVAAVGYATTGPRRAGPEVVGVSPSGPAQRCPARALPTTPGSPIRVVATDPTGRYFVGWRMVGQETTVVLWTDGRLQNLDISGYPIAVNAKGVIVGYNGNDDTAQAWIYRNGYKALLPKPSGYTGTQATGINARGDVVGYAMKNSLDRSVPVFWPADKPLEARILSTPSNIGTNGVLNLRASGIDDDRNIVGSIRDAPVYWSPDGTVHKLPMPDSFDTGNPEHLRGRYAYGQLGSRGVGGGVAVRWDLASGGQPTVVSPVRRGAAQVDGTPTGWTLASDVETTTELIDPNGVATPLLAPGQTASSSRPAPTPTKSGSTSPDSRQASSISDDGKTIVGWAGEGAPPVVWRC